MGQTTAVDTGMDAGRPLILSAPSGEEIGGAMVELNLSDPALNLNFLEYDWRQPVQELLDRLFPVGCPIYDELVHHLWVRRGQLAGPACAGVVAEDRGAVYVEALEESGE